MLCFSPDKIDLLLLQVSPVVRMCYCHPTQGHGLMQFKCGTVSPPISNMDMEQSQKTSMLRATLRYGDLKQNAGIHQNHRSTLKPAGSYYNQEKIINVIKLLSIIHTLIQR